LGSSTIGVSVVSSVPLGNGLEKLDVVTLVLPTAAVSVNRSQLSAGGRWLQALVVR